MRAAVVDRKYLIRPGTPLTGGGTWLSPTAAGVPAACPGQSVCRIVGTSRDHNGPLLTVNQAPLIAATTWAAHDPACPASTHVQACFYAMRFDATGVQQSAIVFAAVSPDTPGWQRLAGHISLVSSVKVSGNLQVNSAGGSPCTWYLADPLMYLT